MSSDSDGFRGGPGDRARLPVGAESRRSSRRPDSCFFSPWQGPGSGRTAGADLPVKIHGLRRAEESRREQENRDDLTPQVMEQGTGEHREGL